MQILLVCLLLGWSQAGKLYFKPHVAKETHEEYHLVSDGSPGIPAGSSDYKYKARTGELGKIQVEAEDVVCPDKAGACPTGHTCCPLATGKYGCCPFPNAVCCPDKKHCCPFRTKCDAIKGRCVQGSFGISWSQHRPAKPVMPKKTPVQVPQSLDSLNATLTVGDVVCPDHESRCPSGSTCCRLASGHYGCCPQAGAVCCADHIHCCPHGTTCDVRQGKCNKGTVQLDWSTKTSATAVEKVGTVVCPDSKSSCEDGQTCCKTPAGLYGCCPLKQAVCCSDHLHCCPQGTTCDVSAGKCNRGNLQIDWFTKTLATQTEENVVCPDGQSQCPSGSTCCKLSSGQYGCCPIVQAVCCSDGKHCCPQGTTCDVSEGKCTKGNLQIDWFTKTLATQTEENVVCPDKTSQCPAGSTCCKLSTGQFGCCPIVQAVCCSDGKHCCPHGTTCEVSEGKCTKGNLQIDWFTKTQATQQEENVVCPDGQSQCPSGRTCCKLSSGQYGCCPLPQAVCCSDGKHCCPHGTTCEVSSGKCNRGNLQIDWFTKTLATQKEETVVCPDKTSQCPTGSTCCQLSTGQYGCCPLSQAVCCSDHIHCCPHGTTCNVATAKCNKGNLQLDWFEKTPALAAVGKTLETVPCPDGSYCVSGETCCPMDNNTTYGCCPCPNAVCCSDEKHCCPSGYQCSVATGNCVKQGQQIAWLQRVPATRAGPTQQSSDIKNVADKTCDCTDSYPDGKCCNVKNVQFCCPPKYICGDDPEICRTEDFTSFIQGFPTRKQEKPLK